MPELKDTLSFEICRTIDDGKEEMKRRGWKYIKQLGYEVYDKGANVMQVDWINRNKRMMIIIHTEFEENFRREVLDFEVPIVVFDTTINQKGI